MSEPPLIDKLMAMPSISELMETADKVTCKGWEFQHWKDGTYFLINPDGEGTQVPEQDIEYWLGWMFKRNF